MSEANRKRYQTAMHAMQTGVAYVMEKDPKETEPKHLRVGVNAALRDHASLVQLLTEKGIISQAEYIEAIATGMEMERNVYQARVRLVFDNDNINLA